MNDPAETIRRALGVYESSAWVHSEAAVEALAALDALLAERQQDKQRIERLEKTLAFYADSATYEESSEPHPTRFAGGGIPIAADLGERAVAALAGEEDAENG